MTEDWRKSLDNREAVMAVAVDLSKAFDYINHNLLLAKLKAYGLSNPALGANVIVPTRPKTACQTARGLFWL